MIVQKFDWKDDFSSARNNHLKVAAELGFDWAVTLDTDERIVDLMRDDFVNATTDVLYVHSRGKAYKKQRCFRLPCMGKWFGKIHEAFMPGEGQTIETAHFWEVPKSPKDQLNKMNNVIKVLRDEVTQNPGNQRAWYYLADAYTSVGNDGLAISAFHKCADLKGWSEETAWAMYRAAECHCRRNEYQKAIECCAKGLGLHPGIAELPWLAGFAAFQLGLKGDATCWAILSKSLGCYNGIGKTIERLGFKNPFAQYEGPFDLLKHIYKDQPDYGVHYERAVEMRLKS